MRRLLLLCGFALAAVAVHAQSAPLAGGTSADTPLRPVTRTVALTNARVVVAPGRVLDRATVLVRDGRIEAVGARVAVPFDARVIAADSLTVYAGFVDSFSTAGVPVPPDAERFTGDPSGAPRERAGLTPDRDVRALYAPADDRVTALREAGFTLAHVVPRDGFFSGQGALVSLRAPERGEAPGALFLRGPVSVVARIAPARGVYPATPMGVLAVMRQAVENARRGDATRRDDRDARLAYDPVANALAPVLRGEHAFWFVAESTLDAFRALRASAEMDLSPILAGVPDALPLLDRLRTERLSVVAPLALPDTVAADSLSRAIGPVRPGAGGLAAIAYRRTDSHRDLDAERAALTAARRAAITRAEASPATLAGADVPFSFGSFGADADDVLPNLRRMVAAGLSEDDALAALTTAAAALFGVERVVGTVEAGRLAHLVVADGPLFADETRLHYVLVDGVVHEIESDRARTARSDSASVTVTGAWRYEGAVPEGVRGGTFLLTRAGGAYGGTLVADGAPFRLTQVTLDGATLSFRFTSLGGETIRVSGTVDGDTFTGTAETDAAVPVPVVATRLPD